MFIELRLIPWWRCFIGFKRRCGRLVNGIRFGCTVWVGVFTMRITWWLFIFALWILRFFWSVFAILGILILWFLFLGLFRWSATFWRWSFWCTAMAIPFTTRHFYQRRYIAIVMVGARAQFTINHFAKRWWLMTSTDDAFAFICCLIHTLVAIPTRKLK